MTVYICLAYNICFHRNLKLFLKYLCQMFVTAKTVNHSKSVSSGMIMILRQRIYHADTGGTKAVLRFKSLNSKIQVLI